MVTPWIGIAVAAAVVGAEWLHARRVRRIARLAFGPGARARAWTRGVPVARALAAGVLAWGLLTLIRIDGAGRAAAAMKNPDQHLVVAIDVSPSMHIKDAGPGGKQSRGDRARDVLKSVFDRLNMSRTRVSVVAFYTSAKPVVVDTVDLNVVNNILGDLPLEQAFKDGPTAMYSGVHEAASLAKAWRAGSTTLVVVSDGDTLPDSAPPQLPAAIGDTLVLGVGDPFRTTQIAGHASRQDAGELKRLAARLRGVYHDGNAHQLPSTVLAGLRMMTGEQESTLPLRTLALIAVGSGGAVLALIPPLLLLFGAAAGRAGGREGKAEAMPSRTRGRSLAKEYEGAAA